MEYYAFQGTKEELNKNINTWNYGWSLHIKGPYKAVIDAFNSCAKGCNAVTILKMEEEIKVNHTPVRSYS